MYRALYRKWRPARFEDVVGQESIVAALKSQIVHERIGHAYLFTGTRGTGKTTCAKIFAKAVNCESPENGDPCGKCALCTGIDNGSVLDVVEIDAATNTGVDDIRELRDETAYAPSQGKYKVYIIDEVHMLSPGAFNALLKIMEEPPSHVIFILATTEVHKVPPTILSRCQRYDFTRIRPQDIAKRLQYVAQQEGLALDEDAAGLIARLADGAMRDALSILDTCAGVSETIDAELVRRMAGVTDKSYLFEMSDAITRNDAPAALLLIAQLREKSIDIKRLCDELILHYRNLMLVSLQGGQGLLTGVSAEDEQRYLATAPTMGRDTALRAVRTLGDALDRMGRSADARIELELAVFALCNAPAQPVTMQTAPVQAAQPVATPTPAAAPTPSRAPAAAPPPIVAAPPAPAAAQPSAPEEDEESPLPPMTDDDAPPFEPDLPPVPTEPEVPARSDSAPAPIKPTAPAAPTQNVSAPAQTKPAAPVASEAPTAPVSPAAAEDRQPFERWAEVVAAMKDKDGLLYTNLASSHAYRSGRRVLIDGTDLFLEYIRKYPDLTTKTIKETITEVTGETCSIGPYPKAEKAPVASNVVRGQDTLAMLAARGIPVENLDEK